MEECFSKLLATLGSDFQTAGRTVMLKPYSPDYVIWKDEGRLRGTTHGHLDLLAGKMKKIIENQLLSPF